MIVSTDAKGSAGYSDKGGKGFGEGVETLVLLGTVQYLIFRGERGAVSNEVQEFLSVLCRELGRPCPLGKEVIET